jgi:hypothetical protein
MISNFSLSDWQAENENISEVDRAFPSFWIIIQSGRFCHLVVVREKSSVMFFACGVCGQESLARGSVNDRLFGACEHACNAQLDTTRRHISQEKNLKRRMSGCASKRTEQSSMRSSLVEQPYLLSLFFSAANTHLFLSQNPMPHIGGFRTNPKPLPALVLPRDSFRSWINRRMSFHLTHQVERQAQKQQGGVSLLLSGAHHKVRQQECRLERELDRWCHLLWTTQGRWSAMRRLTGQLSVYQN